jgi:antitoxin ParD1/3/4
LAVRLLLKNQVIEMARTMTVNTGEELRGFVESLVESGNYKTNSEVVRYGLRLLQEKQAESKLETLRKLIDEGENSGESIDWDVHDFLNRMKARKS